MASRPFQSPTTVPHLERIVKEGRKIPGPLIAAPTCHLAGIAAETTQGRNSSVPNATRCGSTTIASFDPSGEITQFMRSSGKVKSSRVAPCWGSKETNEWLCPVSLLKTHNFDGARAHPKLSILFPEEPRKGDLRQGICSSRREGLKHRPAWMRIDRVLVFRPDSAAEEGLWPPPEGPRA
jgi:hypothetical protein